MKIYFLSDLHLESCIKNYNTDDIYELYKNILEHNTNENLVLIGDICRVYPESNLQKYHSFLNLCSSNYKTVFLIPGNNEYYNNIFLDMFEINYMLQNLCDKFKNIIFLNNKTYDLNSEIRIVGSTLFNYTPVHKWNEALYFQNMCTNKRNDCRNTYLYIKKSKYLLNFKLKNVIFKYNCKFLISEIKKARIDNKKLIICTHYPGSKFFLKDHTRTGSYNFYSNLDFMFTDPVLIWLCGHSHYNKNLQIGKVLCSMNTVGHSNENTNFVKGKHIDIEYN